jgi:hypothetical protein
MTNTGADEDPRKTPTTRFMPLLLSAKVTQKHFRRIESIKSALRSARPYEKTNGLMSLQASPFYTQTPLARALPSDPDAAGRDNFSSCG